MERKNIPVAEPMLDNKELEYATDAIKSGWISSKGSYIKKFEEKFAEYCGSNYAVSCNNGTSALHLALLALGIKRGDEVILPTFTYIATANAIRYVGAKPIFVDTKKEDWNINPKKIESKITPKTKAILCVHLYGVPCDMNQIMDISKRKNIFVVEDCAEAHGAKYFGKKVGSIGDIGCFSFFGNKIITTGEGGMCVTNRKDLVDKMELFRNQGMSKERRYWHDEVGYNYRMTNIQAAIGLAQLEKIEHFLNIRKEHEDLYKKFLGNLKEIEFYKEKENINTVPWMHSILVNKRDELINFLKKRLIETRPFFFPVHTMPPYLTKENFPNSEIFSQRGINLPSSTNLSEKDIQRVCEDIKSFLKK